MHYGVEELARAAGVTIDTLRYYQAQKLLPPPARAGRRAVYSARHLDRLRRIRRLQGEGLPLGVEGPTGDRPRSRDGPATGGGGGGEGRRGLGGGPK